MCPLPTMLRLNWAPCVSISPSPGQLCFSLTSAFAMLIQWCAFIAVAWAALWLNISGMFPGMPTPRCSLLMYWRMNNILFGLSWLLKVSFISMFFETFLNSYKTENTHATTRHFQLYAWKKGIILSSLLFFNINMNVKNSGWYLILL